MTVDVCRISALSQEELLGCMDEVLSAFPLLGEELDALHHFVRNAANNASLALSRRGGVDNSLLGDCCLLIKRYAPLSLEEQKSIGRELMLLEQQVLSADIGMARLHSLLDQIPQKRKEALDRVIAGIHQQTIVVNRFS